MDFNKEKAVQQIIELMEGKPAGEKGMKPVFIIRLARTALGELPFP
ncbi:MAG: hypothetical protein JW882_15670 [Deltaproteobacteria bacterium]|nr:hypothetical protein [Deltaproteobacteria bacterium]